MTRLLLVWLVAACAAGCSNRSQPVAVRPALPETGDERPVDEAELRRDLEATMLENYLQLTLGNMEAYADSIARDREVTLIGIGPDNVVTGIDPHECPPDSPPDRTCGLSADRLPLRSQPACGYGSDGSIPCLEVYSKDLGIHVSRDGTVGWIFDELSYRVPYQGREAAIPLRITAVFVRDVDRWVMVMEHLSYPLPIDIVRALGEAGKLARPRSMPPLYADEKDAKLLVRLLLRELNPTAQVRQRMARARERKRERVGDARVYDGRLLLLPDPMHEFGGRAFYEAPSLSDTLGSNPRIVASDIRVFVSESERVAWLAANLSASIDSNGRTSTIGLRVTAVLELDPDDGWNVLQAHVSVPVTEAQLEARLFGSGLEPAPAQIAAPAAPVAPAPSAAPAAPAPPPR